MIHSKEAYDIDIKQLMHEIEYKIQIKDLKKKLEISGEEYFGNIKINYDQTLEIKSFSDEPYYIIGEKDNSYEFWFTFYLSLKPKHLIALILDYHLKISDDQELFFQKIEHKILPFMESVVFIPNETQAYEISHWLRTKNIHTSNKNKNIVEHNGTKLFSSPFNFLLKESLEPYCEKDSLKELEQLFTTNIELTTPIVLKRSFKIISLLRPIKRLLSAGHVNCTQKDAAEWISKNFVLRAGETTKQISIGSTQKRFGDKRTSIEPQKAQIKYEQWLKKN